MTPYSITSFRITDLPQLIRLERDIFPVDAFGVMTFLSLYQRGRETFLVVRDGRRIVGYIIANLMNGDTGYIASIAVAEAARGNGLGRRLMETVMRRLTDAGAQMVQLHVRLDNTAAIHLYESLGFVALQTIPDFYGDGAPGLYMEWRGG